MANVEVNLASIDDAEFCKCQARGDASGDWKYGRELAGVGGEVKSGGFRYRVHGAREALGMLVFASNRCDAIPNHRRHQE